MGADKKTLLKIAKIAFEIGEKTEHDAFVSFSSHGNEVTASVYRGGFDVESEKAPEIHSTLFKSPDLVLFALLDVLQEEMEAA